MAQPTFFLQPLAAAISLACFSSVVFAAEVDSAHILAPIVVTAQQGTICAKISAAGTPGVVFVSQT